MVAIFKIREMYSYFHEIRAIYSYFHEIRRDFCPFQLLRRPLKGIHATYYLKHPLRRQILTIGKVIVGKNEQYQQTWLQYALFCTICTVLHNLHHDVTIIINHTIHAPGTI